MPSENINHNVIFSNIPACQNLLTFLVPTLKLISVLVVLLELVLTRRSECGTNLPPKHFISVRNIITKSIAKSIALYGSETQTLRELQRKYLESFEMWFCGRMEKPKWSEKVTNEEIQKTIGEKRTLLHNILHRLVIF